MSKGVLGATGKYANRAIEYSLLATYVFSPERLSLLTNETWRELLDFKAWETPEGSYVFEDSEHTLAMAQVVEDVTELKSLEERLGRQALHAPPTGLPNRTVFSDRLEQALSRAERRGGEVAVLFLDLDDFKLINYSLGHEAGDSLLVGVSGRISSYLGPKDTAAHLSSDEFAVLLEDTTHDMATRVAERFAEALQEPFLLDGREVFVTASVGIALGRGPARRHPTDLLRNAELAMYQAKENGK